LYVFVIGLFAGAGGPGVVGELRLLEKDGTEGWANDEDMFKGRRVRGRAVMACRSDFPGAS
jgi:hypothetical protein